MDMPVKCKSGLEHRIELCAFLLIKFLHQSYGMDPIKADIVLGAFLGAACGDASGAPLEFRHTSSISDRNIVDAINMCGGGPHGVGKGQITDDTELMLHCAYGLLTGNPQTYDQLLDSLAASYCRWISTCPFDIGQTCTKAFMFDDDTPPLARRMQSNAKRMNGHSKANGALMRIIPLVIFYHLLPDQLVIAAVRDDCMLSHPNQTCQDANAVYAVAMAHLMRNPGDAKGAVKRADAVTACAEVRSWMMDSAQDCTDLDCSSHHIGFVRWAFTLTFWHLRQQSKYEAAIWHVLSLGGDTDSSAAIVGGMIGALWGAKRGIPMGMQEPVLTFDPLRGIFRPDTCCAKHIPTLCWMLLQKATANAVQLTETSD